MSDDPTKPAPRRVRVKLKPVEWKRGTFGHEGAIGDTVVARVRWNRTGSDGKRWQAVCQITGESEGCEDDAVAMKLAEKMARAAVLALIIVTVPGEKSDDPPAPPAEPAEVPT